MQLWQAKALNPDALIGDASEGEWGLKCGFKGPFPLKALHGMLLSQTIFKIHVQSSLLTLGLLCIRY